MKSNWRRRTGLLLSQALWLGGTAIAQTGVTTAWRGGRFHVDTARVVAQSDIVLGRPNLLAKQAMPLGNGRLGAAVWSANGMTVQLNRADTMPYRYSPGQVVVPGLTALTGAKDYRGRLDLYNGEFVERGGGMTARVYIQPATDTLIVDVIGAKPSVAQKAELKLWQPRTPKASSSGKVGMLAQTWIDDRQPGSSGRSFGTLAGITADARNVTATVTDSLTVTLSFRPDADGHFRIVVAAPHYNGQQNAQLVLANAFRDTAAGAHLLWWHHFWQHTGLVRVQSANGAGQYLENLRDIYLFSANAESGGEYPGSQAGIGDLFSSVKDGHTWDPAAFWHWNLRMQVAANLGAGHPELNTPYFHLYRSNLGNIEDWTKKHMGGRRGACVPETMRFNGKGIEYEGRPGQKYTTALDCAADFRPFYNARTLSTGGEVSLWVWQQYLATGDRAFLARNYPLMAASARFLMAYEKRGNDGLLHTSPSNAHETQWDVTDPTTDLSARIALYPAVMQAAQILGRDADLRKKLKKEIAEIPPLPRTQESGTLTLLPPSADATGTDVIADSYDPGAENQNVENIGLEPVWPWNLIGEGSPLFALARRTYEYRPNREQEDWSYDPIQAARLGLRNQVAKTLVDLTERYQQFPNGLSNWGGDYAEFYVEQSGIVADALQEALVQDYDGVIRIAPAIPEDWDVDGTVYVGGRTKVDIQAHNGVPTTVVIDAGSDGRLRVENPWPGVAVSVVDGASGRTVEVKSKAAVLEFQGVAGHCYLFKRTGAVLRFEPVTATPASEARALGPAKIGLFSAQQQIRPLQ